MRLTHCLAVLMGLGTGLWAVGLVAAQERANESALDQKFINAATSSGMFEVKSSELAEDRATNDNVKKFAKEMVNDHKKADKELMDILGKKGISAPKMREQDQANLDKLSKLKGGDFDRQYGVMQLAGHKEAVALFEEEAKNGKDADLKAFAEKALPTLREHLKHATETFGGERPSK
jgi:putative membrane protein